MEVAPKQPQIPSSSAWSTPLSFTDHDQNHSHIPSSRQPISAKKSKPQQTPTNLSPSASSGLSPPPHSTNKLTVNSQSSTNILSPNVSPQHTPSQTSIFDFPNRPLAHHSLVRSESAPLNILEDSLRDDFNNLSMSSAAEMDPFSIPNPINFAPSHNLLSSSPTSSPTSSIHSIPSQRKPPHPSHTSNKPPPPRSISSFGLAEILNNSRPRGIQAVPARVGSSSRIASSLYHPSASQNNLASNSSRKRATFADWTVFDMIQNDFPKTPAPAISPVMSSRADSARTSVRSTSEVNAGNAHERRSRLPSTSSLDLDLNRLATEESEKKENVSWDPEDIFGPSPVPGSAARHRRSVSINWTGEAESFTHDIPRSASRPNLLSKVKLYSSAVPGGPESLAQGSSTIASQPSSAVAVSESTTPESQPAVVSSPSHSGISAAPQASAIPVSSNPLVTPINSVPLRPTSAPQPSFPVSGVPDPHLARLDDFTFTGLNDYDRLYEPPREAPVPGLAPNMMPSNPSYPASAFPAPQSNVFGASPHIQPMAGTTDYTNIFNGVGPFQSPFSNSGVGIGNTNAHAYSDSFRDGLAAADSLKTMSIQMAAFLNAQQQLYAVQVAHMAALTGNTGLSNPNTFAQYSNPFNHMGSSPSSSTVRAPWDVRDPAMSNHRAIPRPKHHYDQHRSASGHPASHKKVSGATEQNHKPRTGRGRRGHRSQEDTPFLSGHKSGERANIGPAVASGAVQDSTHTRSPLLEEFRATSLSIGRGFGSMSDLTISGGYGNLSHMPNGREWQLSDIKNNVVEFATDQHGSRFIQQKLETATEEERDCVLRQALTDAQRLMTDVFGNYVVQKLLEYGGENAVNLIAAELNGRMLILSLHMYGCRVVQKALQVLDPISHGALVRELDGHVLKCIRDQNGNHVIQKCVELVEPESVQFIIDAVLGQAVMLAGHSYGCRVVQRILEHGAPNQKAPIMAEIMSSIPDLIKDQYGNYVIQHVVEHGTIAERSVIMKLVVAEVCQLSQHKFASNVVERCLEFGSPDEREVLIEILIVGEKGAGVSPLTHLVRDQFGNYVVQRVLQVAVTTQRERVVSVLRAQVPAIKKYSYGKHIIARLEEHQGIPSGSYSNVLPPNSQNAEHVPVQRSDHVVGSTALSVGSRQSMAPSPANYFYYE